MYSKYYRRRLNKLWCLPIVEYSEAVKKNMDNCDLTWSGFQGTLGRNQHVYYANLF